MTQQDALRLVIACAAVWGENREEGFAQRLTGNETDDECMLIAQKTAEDDTDELSDIMEIRDLWAAIKMLSETLNDQDDLGESPDC